MRNWLHGGQLLTLNQKFQLFFMCRNLSQEYYRKWFKYQFRFETSRKRIWRYTICSRWTNHVFEDAQVHLCPFVVQANIFQVQYEIHENKEKCGGKSNYAVDIYIQNPSEKEVNVLILSYVLSGKQVFTPCDPSSWRDALIVEPSSTESSRFYYEELPESGNIYLKIESGGKKEIFLLPFTLPTPTIATTISSAYHPSPQRDYFRLLNSSLHSLYSWLDLQKFFPYEYFQAIVLLLSLFTVLLIVHIIAYWKKKRTHIILDDEVTDSYELSPFKLYERCNECGKWVYLPFQCNSSLLRQLLLWVTHSPSTPPMS